MRNITEIAFEQSQKGLAQQEVKLESMRQHAGILGAVSALGSGMFGAEQVKTIHLLPVNEQAPIILAIIFLVMTIAVIGRTLWSNKNYTFHLSAQQLLTRKDCDFQDVLIQLALICEGYWKTNDKILREKQELLNTGYFLLILQFLCWTAAIVW